MEQARGRRTFFSPFADATYAYRFSFWNGMTSVSSALTGIVYAALPLASSSSSSCSGAIVTSPQVKPLRTSYSGRQWGRSRITSVGKE